VLRGAFIFMADRVRAIRGKTCDSSAFRSTRRRFRGPGGKALVDLSGELGDAGCDRIGREERAWLHVAFTCPIGGTRSTSWRRVKEVVETWRPPRLSKTVEALMLDKPIHSRRLPRRLPLLVLLAAGMAAMTLGCGTTRTRPRWFPRVPR